MNSIEARNSRWLLWLVPLPILLSVFAWMPMLGSYPVDRDALHEALNWRRAALLEQP
jgi:hypothetical protein